MKIENLNVYKNIGLFASSLVLVATLNGAPTFAYADEVEDDTKIEKITDADEELQKEIIPEEVEVKEEPKETVEVQKEEVEVQQEEVEVQKEEDANVTNNEVVNEIEKKETKTNDQQPQQEVSIEEQKPVQEQTLNEEVSTPKKATASLRAGNTTPEENGNNNEATTNEQEIEVHKVQTTTVKVDEEGKPISGALIQIIDENGVVVDEWISDGEEHVTMLPEGTYTLHEAAAPNGYIKAADKEFTIKVEVKDLDAGVDFSETPCSHYGGTPLYYIEMESQKSEVYCINQDWETPDDNSNYDGMVLGPDDIRSFMYQTVYIDAQEGLRKIDVSDQSLMSNELYNKILDIIYHRQLAVEEFPDLTAAEIRYVTESALKNYTNAGLTRVQGGIRNINNIPTGALDTWYNDEKKYYQYLYPWYRSFVYNPNAAPGSDIFTTSIGQGDAFGTLARHWNGGDHNAKNDPEVRAKIAQYYALYQFLISPNNPHPKDMHLYIYSSPNQATDLSGYDFDNGAYQNLLGITWFNPYDENYKVDLDLINIKEEEPPTPPEPPVVPDEPVTPDEPEKPVEPEKPAQPEKPHVEKASVMPKTGDDMEVIPLTGLAAASLALAGFSLLKRRRDW